MVSVADKPDRVVETTTTGLWARENSAITCRHAPQGLHSVGGGGRDGDRNDVYPSGGDGMENRHPLGADGEAERRVFDVAAPVNGAVAGQRRRADGKV